MRITRLTARETAILKRNLHACYSRIPPDTDFLASFIFDAIQFAHGTPWSELRAHRAARGHANQSMWKEWRAYDRFPKLVVQLKRYDLLRPVRLAQLEQCSKQAAKDKGRISDKRTRVSLISALELARSRRGA